MKPSGPEGMIPGRIRCFVSPCKDWKGMNEWGVVGLNVQDQDRFLREKIPKVTPEVSAYRDSTVFGRWH